MINLSKLNDCTFYRVNTPVQLPPGTDKMRGNMIKVFAPSIEDEINWLTNKNGINPFFYDLRLYRYYIEKYTQYKYYQKPLLRVTNDNDSSITKLITSNRIGNIEEVLSSKPNLKTDMFKKYNTLVEINHVIGEVINNEKDRRKASLKAVDVAKACRTYASKEYNKTLPNKSEYKTYLIIPVNLWLNENEYRTLSIYSTGSKSIFGCIVNLIESKGINVLTDADCVILVNKNEFMVIRKDTTKENVGEKIKEFIKKCKSIQTIDTVPDDKKSAEYIASAQEESEHEEKIDAALEKYGVDQTKISDEQKAKLRAALSKSVPTDKIKPVEIPDDIDIEELDDEELKSIFPSDQPETKQADSFETELKSLMSDAKKSGDLDLVVEARLAGQTVENYRRNRMLKEKFTTLKFDGRTLEELSKREEEIKISDVELETATINKGYNKIRSHNFEKSYNEKLMMYDFANILMHFSTAKPAIYLLNDPVIEDISTSTDKLLLVTVEFEDENRKRSKFSFKMPKMYQEKYLFLNEQKWNIIHQKVPYPVTKTDANLCQVATNYNKIRMHRFGNNISAKITKLKKALKTKPPMGKGVKVVLGNAVVLNKNPNIITSLEFDEFGQEIYRLDIGDTRLYFSLDEAAVVTNNASTPSELPDTCVPFGLIGKDILFIDGMTNKVYQNTTERGELSDFIIEEISKKDPDYPKQFNELTAGTRFVYTRARIMDENIPLIFVISAADPGGFQAVLDKAKINYEFVEKRPTKIDKNNIGIVPFSDGYLLFDRYPFENSLLLNGLAAYPTKELSFYDMGSRSTYIEIFDSLYNRRSLIDGIENFYYLLIDPITYEILERLHLPTKFTELLLYANGLLADNTYRIDSDYEQSRLRSNEIVNVYLYQELCRAYANYKYGRAPKFSIKEDAVIKALMESPIIDSHSKLNITLELENDRQVKMSGPGGLNESRAYTIEKRAYHPSMQGILGINSTPSGEVGINRHMSLNSNIIDARGFLDVNKGDYDGTEILSPGELLNTFACESADVERVAMSISQSKHLVPVAKSGPSLVNFDMERIAPHLSNDFTFVAKQAGKVIAIDQDIMIVQYEDGTYDDIDLSYHADKNTDGGFFIMNQMETTYKPGDKFKSNEILAFDKKYISPKDEFGDHAANIGTLARVAIVSNGGVYEDACYVSNKLAKKLAAKVTKEKIVTVSKYTNIKYLVKVGQEVKANDPILVFDDTQDEFTSQMLAAMADEAGDTDEITATTAPVVSKVTGRITDIRIYYTVPLEELTPSLQKIIKEYTTKTSAREKFLSKYIDPKKANTIVAPSDYITPDATGRVSNIKVGEGVIIKIYVEYLDILGVSDKITNLKPRVRNSLN